MPSRSQEIEAAEAAIKQARAQLDALDIRIKRQSVAAPAAGVVQDVFFRPGEIVNAGQPVVALLPPENRKVRFYVPEPRLAECRARRPREGAMRRLRRRSLRPRLLHRRAVRNIRRPSSSATMSAPSSCSRPRRGSKARRARSRSACRCPCARSGGGRGGAMSAVESDVAIECDGLTKSFGAKKVVDNLTLRVERGHIHGFLGPNGSGKTTTIRMLCGLLTPDAGEGRCLGYDIRTQQDEIKRHVGYMTQGFSLYRDLTIRENLEFVARIYGLEAPEDAAQDALERLGLVGARRPARRRTLRRLEAAPRARRLHSAWPLAAAARRADGGRRSESAPRLLG